MADAYEKTLIRQAVREATGGHGSQVTLRQTGAHTDVGADLTVASTIQDPTTGARYFTPGISIPGGPDLLRPDTEEI